MIQIRSKRKVKEVVSEEERYYIASGRLSAEEALAGIRAHWGIENSLHWVLDVGFRQDDNRTRMGHSAENLSRMQSIALNLIKADRSV